MRVDIELLGALHASVEDVSIVPSASKPRQLLTLLALNTGRMVSVTTMVDELWGTKVPRSFMTTLHTYVSQLRRKMATAGDRSPESKDILVTSNTGYVLNVDQDRVDAFRYQELSQAGRRAMEDRDYAAASRTLATGLSMWRGSALTDVALGPLMEAEVLRLEETRLSDLEMWLDAELYLGRHRLVLDKLAELCAQFPMSEGFHAQFMLALSRSGRQWRALEVFRRLRTTMVDELGIDPSLRIRQLQQAILANDPAVEGPALVNRGPVPARIAG